MEVFVTYVKKVTQHGVHTSVCFAGKLCMSTQVDTILFSEFLNTQGFYLVEYMK